MGPYRKSRVRAFVLVVLALQAVLLNLPAAALADGGDPNLIHACVNPSGLTRIVGPNDVCGSNELTFHWPIDTGASVVVVDCDMGQTISQALQSLATRLTITVKGTCNENVSIDRDNVTLVAHTATGATVSGPDPNVSTIRVSGTRVIIDGLRVTGGRNGISGAGANSLTVQNCLVEATGRTGVVFFQGANGRVDNCTIRNNARDGVLIQSATADVTNSTITGNGRRGITLFNGGSSQIGIGPLNELAGNTVRDNASEGIGIFDGSVGSIRGNLISGNGKNPTGAGGQAGITVNRAVADLFGGNTITGNGGAGVVGVGTVTVFLGNPSFGPPTDESITGNGALALPNSPSGGVSGFLGAAFQIQNSNISGNTGNGVTLQLRSTTSISGGTISNNSANGILLNQGGGLLLQNPPVTVTGNGGFGLQCIQPESSFTGNASGIGINGAGTISSPACTGF